MEEFIQCRLCSKKEGPKGLPGFYYVTLENSQQAIVECSCHKQYIQSALLKIKAKKACLWYSEDTLNYDPERSYIGTTSKKNVSNLQKFITNFEDSKFSSSIIYMYGPNGSQKTTLAQWLGISLLKAGYSVKFLLMQHLVTSLANANFETDEQRIKELEDLGKVDCLILDEAFSKDKVTLYKSGYQLPFLESFVRDRIDHLKKGIIFVSNVDPSEIENQGFGKSLQDFVYRNTVPKGSALLFGDIYHQIKSSFDVNKLFD